MGKKVVPEQKCTFSIQLTDAERDYLRQAVFAEGRGALGPFIRRAAIGLAGTVLGATERPCRDCKWFRPNDPKGSHGECTRYFGPCGTCDGWKAKEVGGC